MDLDYFKDIVFDLLNESDELDLSDIDTNLHRDMYTVTTADGSIFDVLCRWSDGQSWGGKQ